MAAMLVGCLSNVVLDYVFIFPLGMGMFGALATCVAPASESSSPPPTFSGGRTASGLSGAPSAENRPGESFPWGVSSLITEVSSGIVMLLFNQILLSLSGNVGVAAYGIIANLALIVVSIFTGVAQGIQLSSAAASAADRCGM